MSTFAPGTPAKFPLTSPQTKAGTDAAKLHRAWRDAYREFAAIESDALDAPRAQRAAERALTRAIGEDAPKSKIEKLEAQLKAATERAAEPWKPRVEAAAAKCRKAGATYRRFIDKHFEELLQEPELNDESVATAIPEALEKAVAAIDAYRASVAKLRELVHHAQAVNAKDIGAASFGDLGSTVEQLRKRVDSLPVPKVSRHALARRKHFHEHGVIPTQFAAGGV